MYILKKYQTLLRLCKHFLGLQPAKKKLLEQSSSILRTEINARSFKRIKNLSKISENDLTTVLNSETNAVYDILSVSSSLILFSTWQSEF